MDSASDTSLSEYMLSPSGPPSSDCDGCASALKSWRLGTGNLSNAAHPHTYTRTVTPHTHPRIHAQSHTRTVTHTEGRTHIQTQMGIGTTKDGDRNDKARYIRRDDDT